MNAKFSVELSIVCVQHAAWYEREKGTISSGHVSSAKQNGLMLFECKFLWFDHWAYAPHKRTHTHASTRLPMQNNIFQPKRNVELHRISPTSYAAFMLIWFDRLECRLGSPADFDSHRSRELIKVMDIARVLIEFCRFFVDGWLNGGKREKKRSNYENELKSELIHQMSGCERGAKKCINLIWFRRKAKAIRRQRGNDFSTRQGSVCSNFGSNMISQHSKIRSNG